MLDASSSHVPRRQPSQGQPSVTALAAGDHTGSPLPRGDLLLHHGHPAAIEDDRLVCRRAF
jgi:hypothetical protein